MSVVTGHPAENALLWRLNNREGEGEGFRGLGAQIEGLRGLNGMNGLGGVNGGQNGSRDGSARSSPRGSPRSSPAKETRGYDYDPLTSSSLSPHTTTTTTSNNNMNNSNSNNNTNTNNTNNTNNTSTTSDDMQISTVKAASASTVATFERNLVTLRSKLRQGIKVYLWEEGATSHVHSFECLLTLDRTFEALLFTAAANRRGTFSIFSQKVEVEPIRIKDIDDVSTGAAPMVDLSLLSVLGLSGQIG